MLKEIPYSTLKRNQRGFRILTLRNWYGRTFRDISAEYGITPIQAREIYNRIQIRQIHLYIRHISITFGYCDTLKIHKVFRTAYECYRSAPHVCAYLEQQYKEILDAYRAGEPGMSETFLRSLPPLKQSLSETEISRIVELRERKRASYSVIAEEMDLTPERAKHVYHDVYRRKLSVCVHELQESAESSDEKEAVWQRYMKQKQSSKKRYEMLINEKNNHQTG